VHVVERERERGRKKKLENLRMIVIHLDLLAHCEPVTLVTPPNREQHQALDASSKLQDVTKAARPHLGGREFQELEELPQYEDIFAVDSEDHGRSNKVNHRIDMGDAQPIRQPPRRLPLAKQAEVSKMLDDMHCLLVI
jgi:hypothetical protein